MRLRKRLFASTAAALLSGIFSVAGMAQQTLACSCSGDMDTLTHFTHAKAVIIAEVIDTHLIRTVHKEHDLDYILADIQVIESFKQQKDGEAADTKISQVIDLVPDAGNCSIALVSGLEYVFFIDNHHNKDEESEEGSISQDNYVGRCTGSHRVNVYSINFQEEHALLKKLAEQYQNGEITDKSQQDAEGEGQDTESDDIDATIDTQQDTKQEKQSPECTNNAPQPAKPTTLAPKQNLPKQVELIPQTTAIISDEKKESAVKEKKENSFKLND